MFFVIFFLFVATSFSELHPASKHVCIIRFKFKQNNFNYFIISRKIYFTTAIFMH